MAKPDPKNPDTAVRAQSGDSLSAIAKANNLTLSEIKALNPNIVNDAKYNGGKTIFSNTKINIAPASSDKITMGNPNNGMFIGPIPTGTTRTATGYVPEVKEPSGYSPGDFRKAEEKSNEPFYQSQNIPDVPDVPEKFFGLKVNPTPPTPTLTATVLPPPPPVKTATLDIILFDEESIPTDGMFDQIFENIGGQELISITRSDIVNGQKISYQPIKNLSAIQQRYNPNNILSLQQTADKFFAGFSIKLEDKVPQIGNGANGENVYLNATGDLIIEFININADEQIETQISVSGTIYEADLGDYTS